MSSLIQRNDLEALLSKSKQYAVTLLIAPAGSGKTTLLDQWQAGAEAGLVARINLRHNQKSIQQALKYMLAEIRNQVEIYDAPIFNLFSDKIGFDVTLYVESIIQVLNSIKNPITLVVDDFHLIEEHKVKHFVESLFENTPSHVHYIISSRTHPKINLSRLKIEDRLLQIDGADLMLNSSQLMSLSHNVLGYELTDDQRVKLLSVTEGWCAGVKIALLAVKKHGERGLDVFNGGQPDMMDYFASEVYEHFSDEIKQFFLVSSLLDKFNSELCERISENNQSKHILDDLMAQSAFIIEDTSKPGWYRYHSLLLDFLTSKREQYYSCEQISGLYKRCMEACLSIQEYEMAVDYGEKCNDQKSYMLVLEQCCDFWQKQGLFSHVIKALDKLPEKALIAHDGLSVIYAYSLMLSRRFNQAQFFIALLQASSSDRSQLYNKDLNFLNLSLKLLQQDIEKLEISTVSELLSDNYVTEIRMFSLIIAAYVELQNGNLNEAMRLSVKAKTVLSKRGQVFLESYSDLLVALCDRYMGQGVESIIYISKLYRESSFKTGGQPWVNINTAMVVVYYEQNHLKQSKALCEKLLPSLSHACVTDVISTIYLSFSRLLFIEGNYIKSQRILDQLNRILIMGNYARFCSQNMCEMMRQAYLETDYEKVRQLFSKHNLAAVTANDIAEDGRFIEEYERKALSAFYAHCLNGDYQAAKLLMQDVAVKLNDLSLVSRAVVARCNVAVIDFKLGKQQLAVNLLKKVISEYGITSISRTTFDEAPGLNEVFSYGLNNDSLKLPKPFMDIFRSIFIDTQYDHTSDISASLPLYNLTEKELLIYELLISGLSNADISKQSQVALSTTKWHLKNIYQKLGVSNRAQAIARKPSVLEY